MDLSRIEQHLDMTNLLGYTLNIDQKIKLQLGYLKLTQSFPDIDEFKFWGRIDTLTKPYYILVGLKYIGRYQFPHKQFFWASSNFVFAELPELYQQHKEHAAKFKSLFSGDPNKMLVESEAPAEGDAGGDAGQGEEGGEKKEVKKEEDEEEIVVLPKKNFLEVNRLSMVVKAIENDCQIVPVGAYKMLPNHELRPNSHFYGLDLKAGKDIESWQHFRSPQNEFKKKQIEAQNVIFKGNFLDHISQDTPKGCWSIQSDSTQSAITIRSLLWSGYFAYHKLSTPLFGSVYFGDGIKNIDLAFML